jgi:hypothetical protein
MVGILGGAGEWKAFSASVYQLRGLVWQSIVDRIS